MKTNLDESLASIFKAVAKKYRRAFPDLHNLWVMLEGRSVYMPPNLAGYFGENKGIADNFIDNATTNIQQSPFSGYAEAISEDPINDKNFKDVDKYVIMKTSDGTEDKMRFITILDHEFGHQIITIKEGMPKHLSECVCDTFSVLMNIRRFGHDNHDLGYNFFHSAHQILKEDATEYYNTPAMLAAARLAEKVDLTQIPLQDVAWYAKQIGTSFFVPEQKKHKLHEYFASQPNMNTGNPQTDCESAYKATMARKDDTDILEAGFLLICTKFNYGLLNEKADYWEKKLDHMLYKAEDIGLDICHLLPANQETYYKGIDDIIQHKKMIDGQKPVKPKTTKPRPVS